MKKNHKSNESETKVSQNYQTYVPKEIQKSLDINANDKLIWKVADNGKVYLEKAPTAWEKIKKLKGIAKGDYDEFGGAAKYIRKQRDSWDE